MIYYLMLSKTTAKWPQEITKSGTRVYFSKGGTHMYPIYSWLQSLEDLYVDG